MRYSSNPFKHLCVSIFLRVAGTWRKCFAERKDGTVLLVPPTYPNSLGDEAMMCSVIAKLRERGFQYVNVLSFDATLPWCEKIPGIDAEFAYGGLSTRRRVFEIIRLVRATLGARYLILLGADVLDGGYGNWHANTKLDLLVILQRAGVKVQVAGFSFKKEPSVGAVSAFRELGPKALYTPRDPGSLDRFVHSTGLPAQLAADLAFLLPKTVESSPARSWIKSQREVGGLVLGWNINGHLRRYCADKDLSNYILAHCAILVRLLLLEPKLSIVLIPHDSLSSDQTVCDSDPEVGLALYREIPAEFRDRVHLADLPKDAATVAGICENLHGAVSCRMHLAIACLRAGVPVMCWEYQDKVTGLLAGHFETPEAVLDLQELDHTESIAARIHDFLATRSAHEATINEKLPRVKDLTLQNFSICSRTSI